MRICIIRAYYAIYAIFCIDSPKISYRMTMGTSLDVYLPFLTYFKNWLIWATFVHETRHRVLRGIISMWMVWITFATITVVIKKLRGHNWDDLAWKHTWTRRWKTRLLAPWCGHGYTFSSTMCAFMCIFHLWNIHTAGYFNAHDIHLGPNTLFQIVWRLDERAFTVRHHETWPPSLFSPLSNCLIKTL